MSNPIPLPQRVHHSGDTPVLSFTLKDTNNTVIPLSAISSIACTIKDVASDAAVNSRSQQDIKNTNDGVYHATSGAFTLDLRTGDTVIQSASLDTETREIAVKFSYTLSSVSYVSTFNASFRVIRTAF